MKFGSTWLKVALLGSAMLIASGVFAEGKKLTEQFDKGITAAYTPAIADMNNVAAADYSVKFTVEEGKELGEVKFNDVALTAEAGDPLTFKFTMPSDKDATLVAKLKGEAPAPAGKKLTEQFDKGITAAYTPAIADMNNVAAADYSVKFTVEEGKELGEVKFNDVALTAEAGDPLTFKFTMPSDKDATLVAKLKGEAPAPGEGSVLTFELNGAEIEVKSGDAVVNSGDKVAADAELKVRVLHLPTGKAVEKITLGATEMALDGGFYTGKMPAEAATLTVQLKNIEAPEGTVPLTAEYNAEGGDVYLVGVKLNAEGKPANFNFDEEHQFPFNAVKGTWYGVIAEWKKGFVVEKFQRVLLTDGADVVVDLLAGDGPNELKDKEGNVLAYGVLIAFGEKTKVTAGKYVVSFKNTNPPLGTGNVIKVTPNGATVKIMAGSQEVKEDTKVPEGTDLVITVTAPAGKSIDKVEFDGKALQAEADKSYKAKMGNKEATLVVTLKDGTAVEDNAFAAVNVYPNPFAGKLVVNEVAEAGRVTLVNAQGVVLRSVAVNGANQVELDVTDVPAGIYMVVVENGAARRAFKVVK